MLYATLNEKGDLVITASEPIEVYALEAWERMRKAGKANLIIESGVRLSIESLAEMLKKEMLDFRRWQAWIKAQEHTTTASREEVEILASGTVVASGKVE